MFYSPTTFNNRYFKTFNQVDFEGDHFYRSYVLTSHISLTFMGALRDYESLLQNHKMLCGTLVRSFWDNMSRPVLHSLVEFMQLESRASNWMEN